MLITFLVLKLAFAGILKECNRLALEQQLREDSLYLKDRLAQLEIDYQTGAIDMDTYAKRQSEIMQEIDNLSSQRNTSGGDDSLEL